MRIDDRNVPMKKIYLLAQLVMVTTILFCVKTNERNGRVNPFDPQGDNWFPPTVEIIEKDTIQGTIADSVAITVSVSDRNGMVKYLEWSQDSLLIFKVDTLSYKDSTSDSTFLFEQQDSTLYIIKLAMKHDSTFNDTSHIDNPVIGAVYDYYTSYFTFEAADTFQLFVIAVDNDGLESETQDSVTFLISE